MAKWATPAAAEWTSLRCLLNTSQEHLPQTTNLSVQNHPKNALGDPYDIYFLLHWQYVILCDDFKARETTLKQNYSIFILINWNFLPFTERYQSSPLKNEFPLKPLFWTQTNLINQKNHEKKHCPLKKTNPFKWHFRHDQQNQTCIPPLFREKKWFNW